MVYSHDESLSRPGKISEVEFDIYRLKTHITQRNDKEVKQEETYWCVTLEVLQLLLAMLPGTQT